MSSADPAEARDAMPFRELVTWAWQETAPVHRNRINLLIHLFAVPLFVAGHAMLLEAFISSWQWALLAPVCIVASLVLQKIGHSLERQPPHPFTGFRDFVRRLYAEQFCNFWRYLFSGQWYASFTSPAR